MNPKLNLVAAMTILFLSSLAFSAPTKVGNGDDGSDLEGAELVTEGILIQSRDKAIALLEKQQISNLPALSKLIPELKKADIYLSSRNVSPVLNSDQETEVSKDGRFVYARTFAEPHAPVRFFPAALMLSEQQMIKLHIHEALHRALPSDINTDEAIVSDLTLALSSPEASYDRTKKLIDKYLSEKPSPAASSPTQILSYSPKPTARLLKPSYFGYTYQTFSLTEQDKLSFPINGMHQIHSLLYPFGESASVRGVGLKFSYLNLEDRSFVGPIGISANTLFATWRGFDVEGFAEGSFYTLSNEELTNLPKARDIVTIGLSIKKETSEYYTENFISITPGNTKEFSVGNVSYKEDFQHLLDARIEAGLKRNNFALGFYGDFLLTEGSTVRSNDGLFSQTSERIRAIKVGPKLTYQHDNVQVQLFSQHLLDRTPGYSLSDFGSLMGVGAGTSSFGASLVISH